MPNTSNVGLLDAMEIHRTDEGAQMSDLLRFERHRANEASENLQDTANTMKHCYTI